MDVFLIGASMEAYGRPLMATGIWIMIGGILLWHFGGSKRKGQDSVHSLLSELSTEQWDLECSRHYVEFVGISTILAVPSLVLACAQPGWGLISLVSAVFFSMLISDVRMQRRCPAVAQAFGARTYEVAVSSALVWLVGLILLAIGSALW